MQTSQNQQFSFFKNKPKNLKDLNFATIFLVGILSFSSGLIYNFSHQPNPIIKNIDNLEAKTFAVQAINDIMSMDGNYIKTVQDNSDKYFTNKGYNQFANVLAKDYKTQLDFLKLTEQNKQVSVADKYSFMNTIYKSSEGGFYTINFKETLTLNHQNVVKDKIACLNIKEIKNQLKIDSFSIISNPATCGMSD